MCNPLAYVAVMAVSTGVQMYSQKMQSDAQEKQYKYQAALAQQQAAVTKQYAEQQQKSIKDAAAANVNAIQASAAQESQRLFSQVAELTGAQKTTMAKMGIGGVTAADISTSTFDRATMDQMAIRYNANVKSWQQTEKARRDVWTIGEEAKYRNWSLLTEEEQFGLAAKNTRKAGYIGMANTLLSNAATTAYGYKMMK